MGFQKHGVLIVQDQLLSKVQSFLDTLDNFPFAQRLHNAFDLKKNLKLDFGKCSFTLKLMLRMPIMIDILTLEFTSF